MIRTRLWRPYTMVLIICLSYVAAIYFGYGRDPLEFVRPTPSGEAGYDGQFTYCIALDPAYAAPCLDVPAYRYQRILHPLMSRLLGLGDSIRIIYAMVGINVLMLAVGTWALERLLTDLRANRWYALVYGLFGGILVAVRVSTAEPLAYGLVLLGVLAASREHVILSAIMLAFSVFAKETTLFFVAGYGLYYLLQRRWIDAFWLVLVVGVLFGAWQLYLRSTFGAFGIGSGGAMATPFEVIPFAGVAKIVTAFPSFSPVIFGLLMLPLVAAVMTLWALWKTGIDWLRRRWHPYVFLLFANAIIMPFVPFSTYREPLGIARFMPGLVIGVVLYAALRRERSVLLYTSLIVVFGLQLMVEVAR